jgi:hypothetical protein
MSHYAVAVAVPKDEKDVESYLENVLSPFDENTEVAPYVRKTVAEIKAGRLKSIETVKKNVADLKERAKTEPMTEHQKEWLKGTKATIKQYESMTDEQYYNQEVEGDDLDEDGNIISTYNPQSKWDWYSVGGRWDGLISVKNSPVKVNMAQRKDIDFVPSEKDIAEITKRYKKYQKESKKKDSKDTEFIFSDFDPKMSLEDYIKNQTSFSTYAFVDKDGEWHERAKMGWFAVTYDEKEDENTWTTKYRERFIDPLDPEDTVVIVDCHI